MNQRRYKFLKNINKNNVFTTPDDLVDLTRKGRKIKGKDIIKLNVSHEARRLAIIDSTIITWATEKLWRSAAYHHKRYFEALANGINQSSIREFNNEITIRRMEQIPENQTTTNLIVDDFYNGYSNDNNVGFGSFP